MWTYSERKILLWGVYIIYIKTEEGLQQKQTQNELLTERQSVSATEMTLNSVSCDLIFQYLGIVIYIQVDFIPANNSSKIAVDLDRFIYLYFNPQS